MQRAERLAPRQVGTPAENFFDVQKERRGARQRLPFRRAALQRVRAPLRRLLFTQERLHGIRGVVLGFRSAPRLFGHELVHKLHQLFLLHLDVRPQVIVEGTRYDPAERRGGERGGGAVHRQRAAAPLLGDFFFFDGS